MQRTRSLEATRRRGILLTLISFLAPIISPAQTNSYYGHVVSVSDGDSITVLDRQLREHKIRLNGIDAPEAGQEFSQASRRHLAKLVFGREVLVIWQMTDRYERELAKIMVDRMDINLEQLRAGMAWYFREYERDVPEEDRENFDAAEREARSERRGLWQQLNPLPPWEYRARKRDENGTGAVRSPETRSGVIRIAGNRNSGIYHRSDCPDYDRVSERNRVYFKTEEEAKKAGYRKARNCP